MGCVPARLRSFLPINGDVNATISKDKPMPKSGSPRLCILTQFYPPEMGAPQARLSESATRLIEAGWTVEVLTALPNYPAGKIFDGYNALRPVVERINGARVVRVPMYPSKEGVAKRLASYLSFAASAASLGPLQLAPRRPVLWVMMRLSVAGRAGRRAPASGGPTRQPADEDACEHHRQYL